MNPSTQGKVIRCKAAVSWGPKKPLTIEEVEVQPPKEGEVRVKTVNSAVCHTDLHGIDERTQGIEYPSILGHESAGIVESVGEGVTSVKPGDHVIPVFMPHCGACKFCTSKKTNWCEKKWIKWYRNMRDGGSRFSLNGKKVWHFMGMSAFSQYTVVDAIFLNKIPKDVPMEDVCILSCGICSGMGAARVLAQVTPGSTCAVWGLGTVGLSAALGCKLNGASKIIGIDLNDEKEELGKKFGVTHFINPKKLSKPIVEVLREMTEGGFGLDYAFECVGNKQAMRAAFDAVTIGYGKCVIVGVAVGQTMEIVPVDVLKGKSVIGSTYGGYVAKDSLPQLIEDYKTGELMLKEFITDRRPLEDINVAIQKLYEGKGLRTVLNMF